MQPRSLEQRITLVERQMQELKELPGRVERVESQILQLRTELRTELHEVRDALRNEIHEARDSLRGEIRELREDIRIGVEESQNLTRGLHAEAMRSMNELHGQAMGAVASLETAIHRDVVSKLDQILALRQGTDRGANRRVGPYGRRSAD